MKNFIAKLKGGIAMALTASVLLAGSVKAQTLITPTIPTTTWASGLTNVVGLNTAMLAYGSPGAHLYGFAYWDGGTSGGFMLTNSSGSTFMFALSGTVTGTPDIIIGNSSSIIDPYTIAIAYPSGSDLRVDFYPVNFSLGTPGVGMVTTTTYTCNPSTVHIDLAGNYNSTTSTGYPYADRFVVTWDNTVGNTVHAHVGSLNALPFTISSPVNLGTGKAPDVAAIWRTVGGVSHDVALITYLNLANTRVFLKTWDIFASTVSTATTLDIMAVGDDVSMPRIDANDDENNNATTLSQAYYKVVAQVDSSTHFITRTYDNLLLTYPTPYWSSSGVVSLTGYGIPPYNHYQPCVAFGGAPYSSTTFSGTHYL